MASRNHIIPSQCVFIKELKPNRLAAAAPHLDRPDLRTGVGFLLIHDCRPLVCHRPPS